MFLRIVNRKEILVDKIRRTKIELQDDVNVDSRIHSKLLPISPAKISVCRVYVWAHSNRLHGMSEWVKAHTMDMDMDTHTKRKAVPTMIRSILHTNKWQSIRYPLTKFFVLQFSRACWFKLCFTFNCDFFCDFLINKIKFFFVIKFKFINNFKVQTCWFPCAYFLSLHFVRVEIKIIDVETSSYECKSFFIYFFDNFINEVTFKRTKSNVFIGCRFPCTCVIYLAILL